MDISTKHVVNWLRENTTSEQWKCEFSLPDHIESEGWCVEKAPQGLVPFCVVNHKTHVLIEYDDVFTGETPVPQSALDTQIGGGHYKDQKIQPVEYIHANGLGFMEGNVIKYVTRHKSKNGAQDLKKAIHYCQLLLQLEYPDEQ